MDDISLKQMRVDLKGQSLRNKIYGLHLYFIDYFNRLLPCIAVGLWAITGYLFYEIGLYSPKVEDIPTLIGIVAAITGLVIAESQLISWKQEKLLERLEQVLLAMEQVRSSCNALDQNGPRNLDGTPKRRDFADDDIKYGASLIKCEWLNVATVEENAQKVQHQILFIKKLITRRSFRLNKAREIVTFLDNTCSYLIELTKLTKTFENIVMHEREIFSYETDPGYHANQLTQYYKNWTKFNADRKGKTHTPLEDMVPPNLLIYLRLHILIRTLRV